MAFKVKASSGKGGEFETAPAGNHPAVLVGLIDLGTQETEYAGEVKWQPQVYLVWELTTEKQAGLKDRNHLIARSFTLSFNSKAMLRGFIEKWRGKAFADDEEFDLTRVLGQPCLLTVEHKVSAGGNTYARVTSVGGVPKGLPIPPAQNKPVAVELGGEIPEWIPYLYGEPVKDVVAKSREKSGKGNSSNGTGHNGEHLPDAPPEQVPAGNEIPF